MADENNKSTPAAAELRLRAEEKLKAKAPEAGFSRTEEETQRLVHELEVHQIELEMQNTELRQARDEVEKVLEKSADLYDFSPVGYVTLDRNAEIRAVNFSGASLLKVERSKLIGRRFGQFISGKYRPDFTAFLDTVFTDQNRGSCEVTLLNKGQLPLFVQVEAMVTSSGEECRIALIDITGRRQAEDLLREIKDRMYKLVEVAVDAIVMLDDNGTVTFCNAAAEKMFGSSAAEITGKDFHRLFIPERHLGAEAKGFARFTGLGTGPLIGRRTEVAAMRKDGMEFTMELSISALKFQGSWHAIGIMRDVSERKRLETEIQDAREYAENIVETVREPLVVLNSELKVLTANLSFYETFKVTPEETIGNFIYDLGNGQWDIPPFRVLVEKILPHDTVINGYEVEHDFIDIGRKTILLNARQIFRENIGSRIILLAMEDITERKRLETEIQDALEYAENIVETVREPLVVLNSDLKVLTANHSFYGTFKVTPEETIGNFIYDLGNRQWDIPKLRVLVEEILPHDTVINGYEVEHDFPGIGRKTILLNARQIFRENIGSHIILLAMEDITERKGLEAEIQDAREYAENIVETVREPLVVLNSDLKILTANHSFYDTFKVTPEETTGNFIYDVGNRQWDIPKLRVLFEDILPNDTVFNGYEVEHDFPGIGRKTILLNARQIFRENIGSHIILLAMEDITERKQLEAEIQDAREYAENIVETVREPLVVLNSDLKVLTANHSFYETYKVTPEETIGNFIYNLGNGQWDIPKLRVLVEEILPLDTVVNGYEVEHDFPDIGRKIILLNARQIFRENIGSHIILLAMEDITERKQLEAEIQDALEYAENIVETVREPLVVLNSDLKILTANHSFYDTFEVTPEETIGNFIYDIGNGQWDIHKLRVLVEEILPHDTVINGYEVEHDFPDIGRKTILLNARQIFREKIGSRIILLAMEDITERKLAEERISEALRQQQAILNNIPNIAWLKDREGKYVAVNDPFSSALGMAPDDLVGKSDSDIYPPELAVKYEKDFKDVMATGTRTYIEESIVDCEGKTRYVEKIKTPIFNDAGVVIGIIGIAHDVTSRKEVEVKLRHESTHDVLTGLYNRAFFDEELERLSHGRMFPMSIVMADVNGLKKVNDTLGHDAGDDLIRLAARIILGAFRAEDIVARIGGDEFAVLLPGTVGAVAEEAVGRIVSCPEIVDSQVSIAFGIATAESKDKLAEALKLSDERMYRDKSANKNCRKGSTGESC
jgi:diguanylate cyclase (GGDEF)-like protein/PAS domain S-box-containing protein